MYTKYRTALSYTKFTPCSYNRRKLDELPYHYFQLNSELETSPYISDLQWVYDKLCGSNSFQILEDIQLIQPVKREFTKILKEFLEKNASLLNYDGKQFYSHLYRYLEQKIKNGEAKIDLSDPKVSEVLKICRNPSVTMLIPLNGEEMEEATTFSPTNNSHNRIFDLVLRLPSTDQFVVSVSTAKEEICVWDIRKYDEKYYNISYLTENIFRCERVRILKGIAHPTNIIPIDQYKCIVLCRRELRIYDLNTGTFVTKLKGVMNQKMPYYGLHDQSHLVALSRNRMYINLMNLETGKLTGLNLT